MEVEELSGKEIARALSEAVPAEEVKKKLGIGVKPEAKPPAPQQPQPPQPAQPPVVAERAKAEEKPVAPAP